MVVVVTALVGLLRFLCDLLVYARKKTYYDKLNSKNMERLPVFGNRYIPSFFQHTFPGKLAWRADMSVDIVQKAHPGAKGPISTRLIENIVSEVEMFEMIYVTKEDMKSVKFSLM